MPYSPTPEELVGALEDVAYEIEQLVSTTCLLRRHLAHNASATEDDTEAAIHGNLYLECFLLHTRVLLDFFEKTSRSRRRGEELDDVLSTDYSFPASEIQIDPESRQRINQEVAHLSFSRVHRRGSKDWFPARMAAAVFERCEAFASHVAMSPALQIPDSLRDRFAGLRETLQSLRQSSVA